jgi:hypothetical protein
MRVVRDARWVFIGVDRASMPTVDTAIIYYPERKYV